MKELVNYCRNHKKETAGFLLLILTALCAGAYLGMQAYYHGWLG